MRKKYYLYILVAVFLVFLGLFALINNSKAPGNGNGATTKKENTGKEQSSEEKIEVKNVNLAESDINFEDDADDLEASLDGAEEFDSDDLNADAIDDNL